MNEHDRESSPASPAPAPEAGKPSALRSILFVILAVMVVALIYEYGFVLRSYRAAEASIDNMLDEQIGTSLEDPITPDQVSQRFGKQPLNGLEDKGDYYVEHYQWRRWLPWKTFDIYVVYESGEPPVLFNSTRPDPPGSGELPMKIDPRSITGTVEMPDMSDSGPRPTPDDADATQDDAASVERPATDDADEAATGASTPPDAGDAKPDESPQPRPPVVPAEDPEPSEGDDSDSPSEKPTSEADPQPE